MKYLLLCCCLTNLLLADNFYYEFDKKVELKNVIKSDSLSSNDEIQEYVTTSGEAVKFKNEIFKNNFLRLLQINFFTNCNYIMSLIFV